jgi:hypothetical protein
MANATAGVSNVTRISGDDMDVGVSDRLAGRFSTIDAEIEAVWFMFSEEEVFYNAHQLEAGGICLARQVKDGGDMGLGNNKTMPG